MVNLLIEIFKSWRRSPEPPLGLIKVTNKILFDHCLRLFVFFISNFCLYWGILKMMNFNFIRSNFSILTIQKPSLEICKLHKMIGDDLFICFKVYWAQTWSKALLHNKCSKRIYPGTTCLLSKSTRTQSTVIPHGYNPEHYQRHYHWVRSW